MTVILLRNPHLWAVIAMTALIGMGYYGDQVGLDDWAPFGRGFFTSEYTHDVHRALFLIPMLYAAVIFRVRGALAMSVVVFCIVLPRGLFVSELPDPLLRAVATTIISAMAAVLLGMERDRGQQLAAEIVRRTELEEVRERFSAIFESTEDAVIGKDLDGVINSWNPGAEDLYGYTVDEVMGKNISILSPPESRDELSGILRRVAKGESLERYETTRVTKSGQAIDVSLTISPIRDQEGAIVGASTIARDITASKKSEDAHRRLTAELAERVKELNFLNQVSRIITTPGKTRDEVFSEVANLIPRSWLYPEITAARITVEGQEFTTGNFRQTPWMQSTDIIVANENTGRIDVCYLEERPSLYKGPFLKEEKQLLDTLGRQLGQFVERRRAEDDLKESKIRYQALFETASDGIIVRDLEGRIMMANQAAADITGYDIPDLENRNISQLLNPSSLEMVREKQGHLLETQGESTSERYELVITHRDGSERIVEAVTGLLEIEGQPIIVQAILRDVTGQRLAQEQIKAYAEKITQAQEEERKRIARDLHDETLQALASLGMEIDALISDAGEIGMGELTPPLEELRQKTDGLLESVRRITQDLRPPMLEELGLSFALEYLVGDFRNKSGKEIELEVTGRERRSDPQTELLLFRIVQEALNNARRHAGADKVKVLLEYMPDRLKASVTDDGCGFELAEEPTLESARVGGLGIVGMYERARLMGADLSIESHPGKGTMVTVEVEA